MWTRQARLAVLAAGCLAPGLFADNPRTGRDDSSDFVARMVKEWQPRPEERRFDDIGWAPSIRAALKLARAHDRPVFLFTHDGRMAVGRC